MSTTPGNTKSKSKTFQKESAFMEVMDWVGDNIEVHEWQPEGTCWVGGEPTPHDVRCDLKHRYVITITRFIEPKREGRMNINWQPNHDASRFRKKKPGRTLVENPKVRKPKLDTMLCPVCEGRKKRIDKNTMQERECAACRGEGRVKK